MRSFKITNHKSKVMIKKITKPFLRLLIILMIATLIPWLIYFLTTGDDIFDCFNAVNNW